MIPGAKRVSAMSTARIRILSGPRNPTCQARGIGSHNAEHSFKVGGAAANGRQVARRVTAPVS